MKSKFSFALIVILLIVFLVGCAAPFAPEFRVVDIHAYRVSDLSWEEQSEFETSAARLFATLEEEHNAFIVDTFNFHVHDGGQRQWELHEQLYLSGDFDNFWPSAICSHGHSIAVSIHYFLHNPIEPVDGGNLLDHFIFDPYTLNILVPESLSVYEDDIISAYRGRFWFDKVYVDNIYHENIGTPLNQTTEADLNINIIYVKNNQSYFTFNSDVESESDYLITDPIVRVLLADNIHPAQLRTLMQHGVFLYGTDWSVQDFGDTGRDDLTIGAIRALR